MEKYCIVAVNCPFNNSILVYNEGDLCGQLHPGDLVKVPLGKTRNELGCILKTGLKFTDIDDNVTEDKIKSVSEFYTDKIKVLPPELNFYKWIAKYYHYNLGQLIFDCLPKTLKPAKKLKFDTGKGNQIDFILNDTQKIIIDQIIKSIPQGFSKWLLHGVTGSGKTICYLQVIKKVISEGKSVLFLLPEINLTPQFIKIFINCLQIPIYSYSSAVSNPNKFALWQLLQDDENPKLIIGARSAIFLPIKNLGLIVIDEEHDQSFKQADRCPYNARDVAIKKAHLSCIPIILGSATPSLETFYNFKHNLPANYKVLSERFGQAKLPEIELVDMRGNLTIPDTLIDDFQDITPESMWPFHPLSLKKIKHALNEDEQVLVFINRLGFANYLQCRACGHQFNCPNCSINLKYFRKRNQLKCQYCEVVQPIPQICPECQNMNLRQKGFGTEKLHEVLVKLFPHKKIARFDRDEIKTFKQLNRRLDEFHSGDVDVLIGTQMLSKGHNFKKVNLVLILGIDSGLNFPDFRSVERVYQQLTQVSGRSGRFGKKSSVLIHTLSKDNKIFEYVFNHSFDGFYKDELDIRKLCSCPPFTKIVMIYFTSKFQKRATMAADDAATLMKQYAKKYFKSVDILESRPSFIEKKVNKFTWSVMARSENLNELHNVINTFRQNYKPDYSVSIKIDIDPYHIE
ncbi:MAG: primosomal protein N' [Bacteriovoracaceae bacterium]|nr:primosomal protein N' [Bacteriovoracaceae bacterium]